LLEHKKLADGVRLFIATADQIHAFAKRMGYVDIIEQAGGLVITDTCPMLYPYGSLATDPASTVAGETVGLVATNSAKLAGYQAKVGVGIQYGGTKRVINSAITGKWGG
jgi:predicted aconitase